MGKGYRLLFNKLLINFTWWVNRKDPDGRNVFQGGFLGLDNIGVFDRSAPLPLAGTLTQSDGIRVYSAGGGPRERCFQRRPMCAL